MLFASFGPMLAKTNIKTISYFIYVCHLFIIFVTVSDGIFWICLHYVKFWHLWILYISGLYLRGIWLDFLLARVHLSFSYLFLFVFFRAKLVVCLFQFVYKFRVRNVDIQFVIYSVPVKVINVVVNLQYWGVIYFSYAFV